jgi:CheY-like chemotaxis protein
LTDDRDQSSIPPKRGRILVVDDELLMLEVMRRILGREHEVVTASDGQEALQRMAEEGPFDFVFCDLTMSGASGIEVLAYVKASHPELLERFVFLTGGAVTPEAARALEEAPVGVIEKPFDPEAIRELLRRRL